MLVENRLNLAFVVERHFRPVEIRAAEVSAGLVGLSGHDGNRFCHGNGLLNRRPGGRVVGRFVTSHAGAGFSRTEVDVRAFRLDSAEVLVERLEYNRSVGGDVESGGAVFFNRDDAQLNSDRQMPGADSGMSVSRPGVIVSKRFPGRPRTRNLFQNAEVFHRPAGNVVQAGVNVCHDDDRLVLFSEVFVQQAGANRRNRTRNERIRQPAGNGIVFEQKLVRTGAVKD